MLSSNQFDFDHEYQVFRIEHLCIIIHVYIYKYYFLLSFRNHKLVGLDKKEKILFSYYHIHKNSYLPRTICSEQINFHLNIVHVYRIFFLSSKLHFSYSTITSTICRSIYRGDSFGFLANGLANEKCENSNVDESFREWEGILPTNCNNSFNDQNNSIY